MKQLSLHELQHANDLLAKVKAIDEKMAEIHRLAQSVANEVMDIKVSFDIDHLEKEAKDCPKDAKLSKRQMLENIIASHYAMPPFMMAYRDDSPKVEKSLLTQTVSNKAALMVLSVMMQDLNNRRAEHILKLIDYNIDVEEFIK